MNIKEVRRLNLLHLLESFDRQTVANRCGWQSVTYVNQMVSEHANMGDKTARKIENSFLGFAPGEHWMDKPQWTDSVHDDAKKEIDQMSEDQVVVALKLLRALSGNQAE